MTNDYIDLGCGMDDSPATPMAVSAPAKSYPTFYFTCSEPIDLPDGEFTFSAKGRKVDASENTRDPDDPRYRYEIEVHGFKAMGGGSKKDSSTDVASSLKAGMKKMMAEKMEAMPDAEDTADEGDE